MTTETRKYITYLMPGTLFPEECVLPVESFEVPKSVPLDCFSFRFLEVEYAINDGKEYVGKTTKAPTRYMIGKKVPLNDIPEDANHAILRANIASNSPTKTAILTHLGNWQMEDENTVVISPETIAFSAPLIWKNIKQSA